MNVTRDLKGLTHRALTDGGGQPLVSKWLVRELSRAAYSSAPSTQVFGKQAVDPD